MKLLKLVPDNTNIHFLKWRVPFYVVSILLIVASLTLTATRGLNLGVDFVGTTLSGYTGGSVPELPDFALIAAIAHCGRPVIAEGRIRTPDQARAAIEAGAHAVVVGSAITRPEHITEWFATAVAQAAGSRAA